MPGPGEWVGPELIATEHYKEVSLAVDSAGDAHVAASAGEGIGDGIFYLTNASGSWTRERLTRAPTNGYDGEPSIVIQDDGWIAIVFARFAGLQCSFGCVPVDPQGIFLVTNRSGSWSDAVLIIEGRVQEPSLQGGGFLPLAYSRGAVVDGGLEYGDEDRTVEYAYAAEDSGRWTIQTVGEGSAPSLQIGSDGLARIAYVLPGGRGNLHYAAQAESGGFVIEPVPGDWLARTPLLALSGLTNEPQIVFFNDVDQGDPNCGALYVGRIAGTWSDLSVVFPDDELCHVTAGELRRDASGRLHVISPYDLSGTGVWYANDAGGAFRAWNLREPTSPVDDRPDGGSAIALDHLGLPHVLYVVTEYDFENPDQADEDGLWYGIGPNDLLLVR